MFVFYSSILFLFIDTCIVDGNSMCACVGACVLMLMCVCVYECVGGYGCMFVCVQYDLCFFVIQDKWPIAEFDCDVVG